MQLNTAIFKNKYVIALMIAGAVMLVWYGYREYNTMKANEDLGILISELEKYQGSDAWNYGPNWDGYQVGDDIPEAVKQ